MPNLDLQEKVNMYLNYKDNQTMRKRLKELEKALIDELIKAFEISDDQSTISEGMKKDMPSYSLQYIDSFISSLKEGHLTLEKYIPDIDGGHQIIGFSLKSAPKNNSYLVYNFYFDGNTIMDDINDIEFSVSVFDAIKKEKEITVDLCLESTEEMLGNEFLSLGVNLFCNFTEQMIFLDSPLTVDQWENIFRFFLKEKNLPSH